MKSKLFSRTEKVKSTKVSGFFSHEKGDKDKFIKVINFPSTVGKMYFFSGDVGRSYNSVRLEVIQRLYNEGKFIPFPEEYIQ